ncbi:ABC transporter ATP-binding protein [bacterium]|nr:ABC transporter ATP-binding protein [bacterium]
MAFLEFDNIVRDFKAGDEFPALRGVSFSVEEGKTALLLGPSGSGKTTLLNLAAGLDRPDSGAIRVDGTDVTRLGESRRAAWRAETVGYVFQHHLLAPGTRVLDAVLTPLLWRGGNTPAEARNVAKAMLESVGLASLGQRKVEHLSGGQRQRVALARALAPEPRLVLADEPTAQLDKETGDAITALLVEWVAAHGATMLVVSHEHDVRDWAATARFVLREGQMAESTVA